jgi:SAM-dependent methyltransferase
MINAIFEENSMDSTKRFSDRVADYVKYRPSYPRAIVDDLAAAGILSKNTMVADIGSGTGIFARMFLENGNQVIGVEPNAEMRAAGEKFLHGFEKFSSVNGTAETTSLPEGSADLVTAAQAFHWFDVPRAKEEFRRILRGQKWVVLVWNERKVEVSGFLIEYERLLKTHSPDYAKVDHRKVTAEQMRAFLGDEMRMWQHENEQLLDFESMKGRVLSSSYAPKAGQAGHEEVMAGLQTAFNRFARDGHVTFSYETKIYAGRV